jgi:nicotinate-nucleotide adenylyltransferase
MVVSDTPSSTPRRILVFGGTFDPPHLAHALLPAQAAKQLDCDLILYIPAAINPLKISGPHASGEQRLAMLVIALADVPNAKISTIELDRPGPSYTIDTLLALRDEYRCEATSSTSQGIPEFRLLIGCDQAVEFHRWKQWREIVKIAAPVVMLRPPWNEESFKAALRESYSADEVNQWMKWTLRLPLMDISGTEIRQRLKPGDDQTLREILDPAVLNYIRQNRLYL